MEARKAGKRALTNISNVNVGNNGSTMNGRVLKRNLDTTTSPNKSLVNKKTKQTRDANNASDEPMERENEVQSNSNDIDLTRSIERKVKAIEISSKRWSPATCVPSVTQLIKVEDQCDTSINSNHVQTVIFSDPSTYYKCPISVPNNVEDFDKTQLKSIESEPQYAFEIFQYYRAKEVELAVKKYIETQPDISKGMRSVLVDWMVEVQESFELNHETLYLAVKIVDHFLMREKIAKSQFQLIGVTAVLIAAKYDERIPPSIEDLLYICDDAYDRRDIILMEMNILHKLDFNIGFPLSYRFLRRYARCAKLPMELLTLARYILEMSLMNYELIEERDSKLAAAALLLAIRMRSNDQFSWNFTLEFYSGYKEENLTLIMFALNEVISSNSTKTRTIKTKYSHKIFYEVSKMSPLPRKSITGDH